MLKRKNNLNPRVEDQSREHRLQKIIASRFQTSMVKINLLIPKKYKYSLINSPRSLSMKVEFLKKNVMLMKPGCHSVTSPQKDTSFLYTASKVVSIRIKNAHKE